MTTPFSDEEIEQLRNLLEVEAIKKVRQLYSHLMDTQQVDALVALFSEDAICEFGPDFGTWHGRETISRNYHQVFTGDAANAFQSMHNISNHWVELIGTNKAVGRSYLIDAVTTTAATDMPIVWLGVYDEAYEKVNGKWLISRCSLHFFWPKRGVGEGFPQPFPPHPKER